MTISAVNLIEGGALAILKQCLAAMSQYAIEHEVKCYAIVNNRELCKYPNIEYIEKKWPKKNWLNRVWFEYVYAYFLSKKVQSDAWLSLHDTTPTVKAKVRAVYCHNPTMFYRIKPSISNYKEYLFSLFYKYLYVINIHKNDYIVVQQQWIKKAFCNTFSLSKGSVITLKPETEHCKVNQNTNMSINDKCIFVYPAFPRTFKNFEIICQSCKILEDQGICSFEVLLTISGTENDYSENIVKKYSNLKTISFIGLQPKEKISELYEVSDCLIFPSKLETWGLPISEYMPYNKPIIAADLPYAHETSEGCNLVSFFEPNNAQELALKMKEVIDKRLVSFSKVDIPSRDPLTSLNSWYQLFDKLMQ